MIKWQLQHPVDGIIFDCDGTLSAIEGIDELARLNGVGEKVEALTADAMGKTGIYPELYKQRIELVKPTLNQIIALGKDYFKHKTPDANEIINLFHSLNKSVYLVSAGLLPSVSYFGELLEIPRENIFAVDVYFDSNNHYLDFDHTSPLIDRNGKRIVVSELKTRHQHLMFVGDGLNDIAALSIVTRFVGYGGSYFRENIAALCDFYIKTLSFSPLLPLALTQEEADKLTGKNLEIYQRGMAAIENGLVIIK